MHDNEVSPQATWRQLFRELIAKARITKEPAVQQQESGADAPDGEP